MINCLIKSLEIDIAYSVNSFIYTLSKLPIFKDLITEDIYSSKFIKKIVGIFGVLFSIGRVLALKFLYFFIIFYVSTKYFESSMIKTYFHIYFVFTIIGIFINNKLLNTSKKKYFSLILFNMDATEYFRANIFWNSLTSTILNSLCIFFFNGLLMAPIKYSIVLILYTLFARWIGETLNIIFYRKYKYIWYSNTKIYFTILITLLLITLLPYINIHIPWKMIEITTLIFGILGSISIYYLLKIKDYKLIYKKISSMTNVMNSKNDKDYFKQAMVAVTEKDKIIDNKKIKGKKGYDLFNTIFYERHKEILIRSAKKYSLILIGCYIVFSYLIITNKGYYEGVEKLLSQHMGWFIIIMYFVNRGAIITQAMFFNCDHAMLRYNFYREPNNLLGLFKKRLWMVIKVNLLPAIVVGIGNTILLVLTNQTNFITYLSDFLFILSLSTFFSVHYLVIYYLMQPFNKDMEVKKMSYSFATLGTYILCYTIANTTISATTLSIFGILFVILYTYLSLKLVYRFAPKTFKLN